MPQEIAHLDSSMAAMAEIIARHDQRHWAQVIEGLRPGLRRQPHETARAVLALYEGPTAGNRIVMDGDWAIDTVVLTTNGFAFKTPGLAREEAYRYARLRRDMYQDALAIWLDPTRRRPLPLLSREPVKLADYGGGSEVWAADERYFIRYDCGHLTSLYRDDEVMRQEAEQGMMGPRHFTHLILTVQNLKAIDGGSVAPSPDPATSR